MPVPRQCRREDESAGAERANGARQRLGDERGSTRMPAQEDVLVLDSSTCLLDVAEGTLEGEQVLT